jgi:hypothetical protein
MGKPVLTPRQRYRQRYKDFGKPNPKKEKEIRESIIKLFTEDCPFHENCPWCNMEKKA